MLMCAGHWRQVPPDLQRRVYAALRAKDAGAESGMREYVAAVQAAREAVTPRQLTVYRVPAGTRPFTCKGPNCGKAFYWVKGPNGIVPVDCTAEGGVAPSEAKDRRQADLFQPEVDVHDGKGVNHFLTCPDATLFTRTPARSAAAPDAPARGRDARA